MKSKLLMRPWFCMILAIIFLLSSLSGCTTTKASFASSSLNSSSDSGPAIAATLSRLIQGYQTQSQILNPDQGQDMHAYFPPEQPPFSIDSKYKGCTSIYSDEDITAKNIISPAKGAVSAAIGWTYDFQQQTYNAISVKKCYYLNEIETAVYSTHAQRCYAVNVVVTFETDNGTCNKYDLQPIPSSSSNLCAYAYNLQVLLYENLGTFYLLGYRLNDSTIKDVPHLLAYANANERLFVTDYSDFLNISDKSEAAKKMALAYVKAHYSKDLLWSEYTDYYEYNYPAGYLSEDAFQAVSVTVRFIPKSGKVDLDTIPVSPAGITAQNAYLCRYQLIIRYHDKKPELLAVLTNDGTIRYKQYFRDYLSKMFTLNDTTLRGTLNLYLSASTVKRLETKYYPPDFVIKQSDCSDYDGPGSWDDFERGYCAAFPCAVITIASQLTEGENIHMPGTMSGYTYYSATIDTPICGSFDKKIITICQPGFYDVDSRGTDTKKYWWNMWPESFPAKVGDHYLARLYPSTDQDGVFYMEPEDSLPIETINQKDYCVIRSFSGIPASDIADTLPTSQLKAFAMKRKSVDGTSIIDTQLALSPLSTVIQHYQSVYFNQ